MLPLIALLSLAVFVDADVAFTHASLYDEYDLNGNQEIGLGACAISGCSVYVSTPQWNVENLRNIYVYGRNTGTNTSLYSFATDKNAATGTKTGLHLSNTEYSIMNYNSKDAKVGPVVIYVVGAQAAYYQDAQVEIYEAADINMRPTTNKKMTVIMSAEPYNIYVEAAGSNLNAFVRATGFDNNFQRDSPDNCRIIYDHNEGKPFRLRINSPIITINFDGQSNYKICANIDQYNGAPLDYQGMATSQGYVGCAAFSFQRYRSSLYASNVFTLTDSTNTDRNTDITYVVNTVNTDNVQFTSFFQGGSNPFTVTGRGTDAPVTHTEKAYKINIVEINNYGSSYWVGYKPQTGAVQIPSGQGVCTDWGKTTTPSVTTGTMTTSGASNLLTLLTSAMVFIFARQF